MNPPTYQCASHRFDVELQASESLQPPHADALRWSQGTFFPLHESSYSAPLAPSTDYVGYFESMPAPNPHHVDHFLHASSPDQQGFSWSPIAPPAAHLNVDAFPTVPPQPATTAMLRPDPLDDHFTTDMTYTQARASHDSIYYDALSPSTPTTPVSDNSFHDSSHAYRRLFPPINPETVDASMDIVQSGACAAQSYICLWHGCFKTFKRRYNAREHVESHLVSTKLFQCTTCLEQFSSEGTARRHRDTRSKSFTCKFCNKPFARKDYRNLHERLKRCSEPHTQS